VAVDTGIKSYLLAVARKPDCTVDDALEAYRASLRPRLTVGGCGQRDCRSGAMDRPLVCGHERQVRRWG